MAPRAPKRCARCPALVPPGRTYCPTCQPAHTWTRYPSPRNTTVNREDQRRFRAVVLAREPRCRQCGAPATEADHVVPIAEGGTNDPHTNGQALCEPCHDAKTQHEAQRARPHRT